jgi:hypothetical protein
MEFQDYIITLNHIVGIVSKTTSGYLSIEKHLRGGMSKYATEKIYTGI